MKNRDVLTKNARAKFYLRANSSRGRSIANSKIWTKKVLQEAGAPVPKLIGVLKNFKQIERFSWEKIESGFVIKPAKGSGGDGIWIVKRKAKWAGEWFLVDGRKVSVSDFRFHCLDILQGRYSLGVINDKVLIEERVKIHPKFLRFTKSGTPDVRVVVYNKIPVMAMLRIPTEESNGKANLQQGAIGLGIDMATGITTYGGRKNPKEEQIFKILDLRRKKLVKVNGIRVPMWDKILEGSIKCALTVPGLNFFGIDFLLDKEKGPLVIELNARPGLSIQICNQAGLKDRLEKVEGIGLRNVDHGIRVAKALFAESFVDKVKIEEGIKIIEVLESVKVKGADGKRQEVLAKIDTGAMRSSIDRTVAESLGLLDSENVLFNRHYRSSLGRMNERPVIEITFWLKGKKIKTTANIAGRKHLHTSMLIGRQDMGGFLVRPEPVSTSLK